MERTASATEEVELLQRLRQGEDDAFRRLFELHVASVRRLARGIARDASEAEDITAETFFRVLQAVRRGNGPRDNVRAYLLTVARRVTWEWHGSKRDVPVSDDELTTRAGAGGDTQSSSAEATLITRAFSSLPERWRTVLWQTEVEGVQPANVAPEFGLSPNATAALARRARIGLRAAYLQAHLSTGRSANGCRTVVEKLGGYTAGSVTGTEARKVRSHLSACASCRTTHDELMDVCSTLRSHAGVLVLLVPASGLVATSGGAAGGAASGASVSGASVSGASVSGVSSAGAVTTSAGAATSGVAALGAHVKVGLAVASTVVVGAAGVVAVGQFDGDDQQQAVGLHGGPGPQLRIVDRPYDAPEAPAPPKVERAGDTHRDDSAHHDGADHSPDGAAGGEPSREPLADTEYSAPPQPDVADSPADEPADQPAGDGPESVPDEAGDAPPPAPRDDLPVSDGGNTDEGDSGGDSDEGGSGGSDDDSGGPGGGPGKACGIPELAAPDCPPAAGPDGNPPGQEQQMYRAEPTPDDPAGDTEGAPEARSDVRSGAGEEHGPQSRIATSDADPERGEPLERIEETRVELLKIELGPGRKPAAAHFRGE